MVLAEPCESLTAAEILSKLAQTLPKISTSLIPKLVRVLLDTLSVQNVYFSVLRLGDERTTPYLSISTFMLLVPFLLAGLLASVSLL